MTAVVILGFRYAIDATFFVMPGNDPENFEGLDTVTRSGLVVLGALLLGILLNRYTPSARRVGVVHVMERLSLHQGRLPLRNAMIQFVGGAIALVTGQSGGREGPAIHLGATAATLLGQQFKVPNNSLRTLVACGTAAAIASSFNTPIAGVIFAMEVVMMEYTIASFIPVIVASVVSTLVTQFFFGSAPAFNVAPSDMHSVLEIPYLVLGGILIGALAAGYIQLIQAFARLSDWPFWIRAVLAGTITGGIALFLPQVMGIGYDTVNDIMVAKVSIFIMAALVIGKTISSAATVGLGLPVGLIGPSLLIGAAVGGIFGNSLVYWQGADISVGLYVMLGMCAMMASVLQAPLAALMAVMEMTGNTSLVLPAMVTIVVATLVTSQVFKQRSVFISTLNTLGLTYPPSPVALLLQKTGVTAIMDRSFVRLPFSVSPDEARSALEEQPSWIVVDGEDSSVQAVLNPADLAAFMEEGPEATEADDTINLLKLPGQRMDVTSVNAQATVMQVQDALTRTGVEACCVTRTTAPMINPIVGVVTQSHIDNYRNVSE